jgi:hypothetical protein
MEEVLREYVREVNVAVRNGQMHLKLFNRELLDFYEDGVLVMVDGVALPDRDKIFDFDPLKVRKLDIVARGYILGPAFFSGILNFSTFEGTAPGLRELYPSLVRLDYEGFQLQREFYAPAYETAETFADRIPDFRNTLYWLPDLKIDDKGKAEFNFYTSDLKGKFLVMVQGMDNQGKPVVGKTVFEVRD